jgi:hypothetical protein
MRELRTPEYRMPARVCETFAPDLQTGAGNLTVPVAAGK